MASQNPIEILEQGIADNLRGTDGSRPICMLLPDDTTLRCAEKLKFNRKNAGLLFFRVDRLSRYPSVEQAP